MELYAKKFLDRAPRDIQATLLLRYRQDEIVYPEKQLANWTAIRYTSDHIFDYIELDEEHAIFEIEVPMNWISKSIGEIDIRRRYNINIMAIKKKGKLEMAISPDTRLEEDEALLVLGVHKDIQKCFHI